MKEEGKRMSKARGGQITGTVPRKAVNIMEWQHCIVLHCPLGCCHVVSI